MGLQGVELVLLGYNTPIHNPPAPEQDHLAGFHNHLSMQAGAYQNATWVVGVAKAGREEGCDLLGQSVPEESVRQWNGRSPARAFFAIPLAAMVRR